MCLVVFDLDHFKAINDRHGHDVGDAVLREVASRVRRTLRRFELTYRIGGEEFALLLPGVEAIEGLQHAQLLRSALADEPVDGLAVTASFGVSVAAGDTLGFADLYRRADQALYDAKRQGRNHVCVAPTPTPETVAA